MKTSVEKRLFATCIALLAACRTGGTIVVDDDDVILVTGSTTTAGTGGTSGTATETATGSTTATGTSVSSASGLGGMGGDGGHGGNGVGGDGGGGGGPPPQESCTNGADDDGDGATDCADTDCAAAPNCAACGGIDHLVLSEVRARGTAGAADEIVEIYNPFAVPVVLDATWSILARGATAGSYTPRYVGDGSVTVPSHGFALFVGASYDDGPAADGVLSNGIADSSSVLLDHGGTTLDALCFYCGANPFGGDFACEGAPVQKLCPGNADGDSVERSLCVDTGDNDADFMVIDPATPENTSSPQVP